MKQLIIVGMILTSCGTKKSVEPYVKKSDIIIQKENTLYVLDNEVGSTIVDCWNGKKWGDTLNAKLVDSVTFTKMMKRVTPVK